MRSFSAREKVLAVLCALCAVAAIGIAVFHFTTLAPSDAAAKVNDTYISEGDIASDIAQYRTLNNLTDNSAFATSLVSAGDSIASFRQEMIDTRAINILVDARAQELGVVPTDDEVQNQYAQSVNNYGFGDEETFKSTLESYGMTEESYRAQIRANLEKKALYEKEVARTEASDDDALSYAEGNLVGVSQKHYYRIKLSGDNKSTLADEIKNKLSELKAAGNLSTDTFSQLAVEYSDDENVGTTGGSFAWNVEIVDDADLGEAIDNLSVGEYEYVGSVASDGQAYEFLYCDTEYSFPATSEIMASLKPSDVPESLWNIVKEKASDALWDTNCEVYLNNLLTQAKITYYPIPDNSSYNIAISTSQE